MIGDDWMESAACRGVGGDWWFCDETPQATSDRAKAKRICNRCDVQGHCLQWALEHAERYGIWGGLTVRERDRIRRRLNMPDPKPPREFQPCGTLAAVRRHQRAGEPLDLLCRQAQARRAQDRRWKAGGRD